MDWCKFYNHIEFYIWLVVGIVCFLLYWKKAKFCSSILLLTFMAFGISDLVEMRTGAWYRPWWLLIWKATCIMAILFIIRYLYKLNHKKDNDR
jgi:hypothetical protein